MVLLDTVSISCGLPWEAFYDTLVGVLDDGFYIEDDGPGIPENKREDVFDAGYSTAEDGAGFGLSIVKHVAEAHGWEIQVTDGSEGGARFEITGIEFAAE
nr:ATP-binding protein [Halobaculum gomorrense]